jgi:uncharacterized OB-fold protein
MADPVQFMQQHIALDYVMRVSPLSRRFGDQLKSGRIVGHKCPSCGLVYVPTRAFCPMCTVAMGDDDEVDLTDKGTVTSYTVLTPIQYHGQQEREEYALASILLDGADGTVGQQRLTDVSLDNLRMGMRVEAVWSEDREAAVSGFGFGTAIAGWRPIDEPDVPEADFAEHVL